MTLVLKEIYSVPSVTLTWQVLIWENVYEIIISKAYCIYYVPETNVSIATFFHFNPKLWKEKWGIQYKRKVYRGWEWNLWKIPYILFTSIQYINTTERIRICKQLYKMNVSNYFKSLKPCPIQLGLFRVTSTTIESWCSFQFVSPFCQFLLLLLNHVAVYCFMPSFQPCKSCIALSLRNSLIKI